MRFTLQHTYHFELLIQATLAALNYSIHAETHIHAQSRSHTDTCNNELAMQLSTHCTLANTTITFTKVLEYVKSFIKMVRCYFQFNLLIFVALFTMNVK